MSTPDTKKTSILVVTYNSGHLINECLSSLTGNPDNEIIVVDNASSDDTIEVVRSLSPAIHIICNRDNLGFAKAVNIAAKEAKGETIFLLNPDAMITNESLVMLSDFLLSDQSIGIVAPLTVEANGEFSVIGGGRFPSTWRMFLHATGLSRFAHALPFLEGHYLFPASLENEPKPVDWVSGGTMMFRRTAFESVGPLTEKWFMYAEDIEFCWRIHARGFRNFILPAAMAEHAVGGSSKGVAGRLNTAWLMNLFEMYDSVMAPSKFHKFAWKLIVSGGFWSRSLTLDMMTKTGRLRRDDRVLADIHRFKVYGSALWQN